MAAHSRPPPLYRSPEGEAAIRQLYARGLDELPVPHETRLLETPSFGTAHVTIAGPAGAPPLVLWHGTATPGPHMLAAFAGLAERFRVHVPDIPCQGRLLATVPLDCCCRCQQTCFVL